MHTNDCTSDFPLRPRRRSIHDIRNLPPTTTTMVPSLLLKSTPGQTSTDQQTVSPLVPLNNMINASNSTRKRSHGLLYYGGSSSRPTITSSTTTSFPPPRGRPRHKNHQPTEKALPPARNSFTVDNIVNAINNQKAGSHGVLGYHNSSFPSLGTTGRTTTSFQSLKLKNHQETEQALRPHKSITIGNMADAGNNHKESHGFLNDHHGSTCLPPITTTTTTTISYPSAKLKNPIQSAHSHEALLPQTSFSYNTNRINANNRLERREHFLDYHRSTFLQPMASRSTTFPIAGSSTTIQQQYSTPFPSSSSFTPRMTSTTFPMAGTIAINKQYSTAFPSSSSFTPPMASTAFPATGSSRKIAVPSSSSFTPPMTSTTFPMAGTTAINQQYSTAFPSSSSFTLPIASTAFPMAGSSRKIAFPPSFSFSPPMTSTTFPMAGRSSTTINHQYSTAFPTSSSYTPPLTSTTFPRAGPLSRLTQQYSNASPSSSLLTPPTTTTISMAGRTTINQQSSGTALPSSSSLPDPSKNWYWM